MKVIAIDRDPTVKKQAERFKKNTAVGFLLYILNLVRLIKFSKKQKKKKLTVSYLI